jgi:hypothetical protein
MRSKILKTGIAIMILLIALPVSAEFSKQHVVAGESLDLKGTATHRLAGLLKICRAALYGPADSAGEDIHLRDVPKRLEIEYFVPVGKDRLIRMAEESLESQFSADQLQPFARQIREFHKLYQDVGRSDRYAMTYHPDRGLTLELNGEMLGSVQGAGFAKTYLAIWLGDDPVSPTMKRRLLQQG